MNIRQRLGQLIPETLRDTVIMRVFGLWKIPLLAFVKPRVLKMDAETLEMLIPLSRRTKNHLGSMYMGSLMIGADVAAAYYAVKLIMQSGQRVDFVFKEAHARFLKRPTGDVLFTCTQGAAIRALVQRAIETGERVEEELRVTASVPSQGPEAVADMMMILSLKKRSQK